MDKNKIVISSLRNKVLEYLNYFNGVPKGETKKGMAFSGNYSCHVTENRTIYIVIPSYLNKTNLIYVVINKVLRKELDIALSKCEVIQDSIVGESKILEFRLL